MADTDNHTIRKITPTGAVTTLAGRAGASGHADDAGSAAQLYNPYGVAVDRSGNIYVGDACNDTIRKGTPILQFDTTTGSLTVSNGFVFTRLFWTGSFGSNVVVEASANLAAWTPIQTNAVPPAGLDVSFPQGTNQQRFFRARLAP